MLNKKIYNIGSEQFDKKYGHLSETDYHEELEDKAWNAYYNDMYKVDTVEEGYYLISEVYSVDLANQFLTECIECGSFNEVA